MADYFKGASALVVAGWIHIKDASSGEGRGWHHGDTIKEQIDWIIQLPMSENTFPLNNQKGEAD